MYESRRDPPLPRRHFLLRLVRHIVAASVVLAGSLLMGMAGYEHYEDLPWRDAFLNTAMLMGGMGPVDAPRTPGGKVFAGLFALYAGFVLLVAIAIVGAPLLHRLLHKFHWDKE